MGIRDAESPAYAKHYVARIFVDLKKQVKRNMFFTTFFSQRLPHNVFSQRLFHTVALTYIFLHNVVLTASQHTRNHSMLYKYKKIHVSRIRQSSTPPPRNFDIGWSIILKPRRCTFQYMFFHCVI